MLEVGRDGMGWELGGGAEAGRDGVGWGYEGVIGAKRQLSASKYDNSFDNSLILKSFNCQKCV